MSSRTRQVISGKAFIGDHLALQSVELTIENGTIITIDEVRSVPDIWICPALFNAHTHLGDTIAMDCGTNEDLVSVVTPPDGLKHRILRGASRIDLINGMQESIRFMARRGTAGCLDFREGGADGVRALKEAARRFSFRCIIFGRDDGERIADGLGISSTRDIPGLEQIVAEQRQRGGLIAFHAGERDSSDVDSALSYDPDLIVHATHATDRQLKQCAEMDIPIVICPRSNWFFSVTDSAKKPPVKKMLELGCRVYLGTDNVMIVQPDMLSEMAFLSTVYHLDPRSILQMATRGSSLGGATFSIAEGGRAAFFIVEPEKSNLSFCKDPLSGIVKRVSATGIGNTFFNL